MYGLNIDPNNPRGNPDPAELRELGVEMVRYTFYDASGGDQIDSGKAGFYSQKAKNYAEAGIGSLVILTYDTYPNKPGPDAPDPDWDNYIGHFAHRAGQIARLLAPWRPAFQVWNEPDHPVHPGYAPTLREAVFGRMLRRTYDAIKAIDPKFLIITGGLASGNPSWLTNVIRSLGGELPADVIAFHPYGQRPDPDWPRPDWAFGYVGNLLDNYYRAGKNKPIWITEMGGKEEDLDNNREQVAEFLRRYYRTMTTRYSDKVQHLFWFCYSDGMVAPFGLLDGGGNRKPAYQAFREVVAERPPRPSQPNMVVRPPQPVTPPPPLSPPPPPTGVVGPPPPPEVSPSFPTSEVGGLILQDLAELKKQTAELKNQVQQGINQLRTPSAPVSDPAMMQQLAQLKNQVAEFQSQVQLYQNQMAQVQSQLQQLLTQQTQLQSQLQLLLTQPVTPPGPVVTPPPKVGPAAPPIQNITQQLKRHPTLPPFSNRPLNQIQRIIIHHTAIPPTVGADRIAAHRVDKQNWPGIGYHYFITSDGLIQQTNELTTVSTHAGEYDSVAIGVCFAGDFTSVSPSPAQLHAGGKLIAWLLAQLGLSSQAVAGYKDLVNTQSPGLQWDTGLRWGDQLRQQIQAAG